MENNSLIDFGKITALMTGSTILGIFLGSRTGGTYTFEVGANLMLVLIVFLVLASSLTIANFWLSSGSQK
ncbi:MAG: hypothetical protein JSV04_05975 [Candidatus Heimdallarchaeota archaeon]|nr:MAG: hypothetical protein JSV04_05975 [Candidatus Heimdallarchaeota archaeon]